MIVRSRKLVLWMALLALLPLPLLDSQPTAAQQAEWQLQWQDSPWKNPQSQTVKPQTAQPQQVQGMLPVTTSMRPPRRPANLGAPVRAAQGAAPAPVEVAAPVQPVAAVPVPQPVPAVAAQPAIAPSPAPMQLAAASAQPVTVSNAELNDAEVVARANEYFNAITMMSGRFTQVGANGSRVGGTLYVHRPGRVRFAYDEPATIDVISDGRSVVVRDRRLATQDLYPVSQTPLKFLIGDRVELGRTIPVIGVERTGSETDVILQDSTTFGGTSRITLTFDAQVRELKQWRILDPQGFETTVTLSGLNRSARVDPSLFVINQQPIWN
jgi:outer membrane lipoprotein-sorting protein